MTTTSEKNEIFAVYRIEGELAILVGEQLDEVAVPLTDLPDSINEETVLLVPLQPDGTPAWPSARIEDDGDSRRRAEDAEALLARIQEWRQEQKEKKRDEAENG